MSDDAQDATPTPDGPLDRWTKDGVTPGEDPREIDAERTDAAHVLAEQEGRPVVNAQPTEPGMGTTTATDGDAPDSYR